jgi:DNA polymerase III epsilon subunit-like protein
MLRRLFTDGKGVDISGKTLIVFDVETTGLNPEDKLTQITTISAVKFNSNGDRFGDCFDEHVLLRQEIQERVLYETNFLVPEKENISQWIKKSGWDSSRASLNESEAVIAFKEWIGKHENYLLVGYNVNFDMNMINYQLKKTNNEITESFYDVMELAKTTFRALITTMAEKGNIFAKKFIEMISIEGRPSYKLELIGPALGFSTSKSHESLDDCKQTGKIYFEMRQIIKKNISIMKTNEFLVNYKNALVSWNYQMAKSNRKQINVAVLLQE